MAPALARDFQFTQLKRRKTSPPRGFLGLYDSLAVIGIDVEWAKDAAS
jgi:hypothetical protein